ncbi:chromosome segregation protein SMC-like [Ophiocordyceps camponoti-floridani]|uniref:Chromosome segregation protein SMC-like n=1 Tax=Ophiocordyceps camponoti-floridani TaxID=2030778 RepID=A0A8H4Q1P1_9HYPO|nr:chromosome segregation protein SMC-like [Ophiocordyceps camponoti-floridani]
MEKYDSYKPRGRDEARPPIPVRQSTPPPRNDGKKKPDTGFSPGNAQPKNHSQFKSDLNNLIHYLNLRVWYYQKREDFNQKKTRLGFDLSKIKGTDFESAARCVKQEFDVADAEFKKYSEKERNYEEKFFNQLKTTISSFMAENKAKTARTDAASQATEDCAPKSAAPGQTKTDLESLLKTKHLEARVADFQQQLDRERERNDELEKKMDALAGKLDEVTKTDVKAQGPKQSPSSTTGLDSFSVDLVTAKCMAYLKTQIADGKVEGLISKDEIQKKFLELDRVMTAGFETSVDATQEALSSQTPGARTADTLRSVKANITSLEEALRSEYSKSVGVISLSIKDLEKRINSQDKAIEDLTEKLNGLDEIIKKLTEDQNGHGEAIKKQQLMGDSCGHGKAIQELTEKLNGHGEAIKKLTEDQNGHDEIIKKLTKNQNGHTRTVKKLTEDQDIHSLEIKKLNENPSGHGEAIEELTRKLNGLDDAIKKLTEDQHGHGEAIEELTRNQTGHADAIKKLTDESAHVMSTLATKDSDPGRTSLDKPGDEGGTEADQGQPAPCIEKRIGEAAQKEFTALLADLVPFIGTTVKNEVRKEKQAIVELTEEATSHLARLRSELDKLKVEEWAIKLEHAAQMAIQAKQDNASALEKMDGLESAWQKACATMKMEVEELALQVRSVQTWQNNFTTRPLYEDIVSHITQTLPNGVWAQMTSLSNKIDKVESTLALWEERDGVSAKKRRIQAVDSPVGNGGSPA